MNLGIILLTYQRTEYALRTIRSVQKNLIFTGDVAWYLADDGSRPEHHQELMVEMTVRGNCDIRGSHNSKMGYGRSANTAVSYLHDIGYDVTLWLEDDWELPAHLDITPYVAMLNERRDIGMVRLGHMPVDLSLFSIGYDGRMYMNILATRQYMYSGNPHLKHYRFMDAYKWMPVDRNPGETEVSYDHQIRSLVAADTPKIVWPLAIGDTFPWAHIGNEQSY